MTDRSQEIPQPVYFLCDVSVHLLDQRRILAELLLGYVAHEMSEDPVLKFAVRWGIERYGHTEDSTVLMYSQQIHEIDRIPALTTTLGEPDFAGGLTALRKSLGTDMTQLDVDYDEVRSPFIVVLTSGFYSDSAAERVAAVEALLDNSPRSDETLEWRPTLLLVGVMAPNPETLTDLVKNRNSAEAFMVDVEADVEQFAVVLADQLRKSVISGRSQLRYLRWVMAENQLDISGSVERTSTANIIDLPPDALNGVSEPLRYRQFPDGADPAAHGLFALLEIVAVRDLDPPVGWTERITERAVWPYRLVVGDDPTLAAGLIVPTVPDRYVDVVAADRQARSIHLLHLDGSAPEPLLPDLVPAGSDQIARAQVCAQLADTVELAHRSGLVLGDRALESALFLMQARFAEVVLADCDDVRRPDPADPHWRIADLQWLSRCIRLCVDVPGGPDEVVLDYAGRSLLARARSNSPTAIPSAAEWRDYLKRRAVELQGPPLIVDVQVTPIVAPSGSEVTVLWRSRYAETMILNGADGSTAMVPHRLLDQGSAKIVVTRPGHFTLVARNQVGERQRVSPWIHVFVPAGLTSVPIPMPSLPSPIEQMNGIGDLLNGAWAVRQDNPYPPMPVRSSSVLDPAAYLLENRGRRRPFRRGQSLQPLMERTIFPYDVSRWFSRRPEPPRSRRSRWWRLPWA